MLKLDGRPVSYRGRRGQLSPAEPIMTALYNVYLPLVQSLNDYGGNFASIHIRRDRPTG